MAETGSTLNPLPQSNNNNKTNTTMQPTYEPHPQESRIVKLVMDEIVRHRGVYLYHIANHYLKVTDDLKMSFPLELTRDGYLMAARRWTEVTVLLKGVRTTVSYPLRLTDYGCTDYDYSYPGSVEELVESLHHHRPRKPLPFPVDDEKSPVVFVKSKRVEVMSDNEEMAEWTTPARPASAINTMLKRMGYEPLETAASNALLAKVDELLLQFVTSVEWLDDLPSHFYNQDRCGEYSSCMKGEPTEYFELYDSFFNDKRLRLIGIFRGTTRVGRALVWTGENPADLYLDRVYAPGNRSTFDPDIVKAVKEFCASEGIAKTCFDQTAQWFGLEMVGKLKLRVPQSHGPDWFDRVPYVDSMRYFGYDGFLRNYEGRNIPHRTMYNTNGRFSGEEDEEDGTLVTGGPGAGDYRDEDETCWVERLSETWLREYCTYSEHLDDYIPDSESVETYDGKLIWKEDAVALFDGDWAEDGDSDLVLLSNGEYAVAGHHEVITMHDGRIMVDDGDLDWTTTADGECALVEDCVEVDGVWYLQGHEPEVEDEETETVA